VTDVLAWFFAAIAVVSFIWAVWCSIWAVWCSIQLVRASRRVREAYDELMADESLDPQMRQAAIELNRLQRWPLPRRNR
jgi:type VI protein secretion system component VasK